MLRFGMIAACAIALSATAANATTYYLQNVKFADGTSATGSFSTNVSGYPDGHSITTLTGTLTGYHYTNDINVSYNPGVSGFTVYHNDPSYKGFLTLTVGQSLDSITTPTVLLTGGTSYECSDYSCPNGIARNVVSGFLSTTQVPEPASWALMLLGFGALGTGLRHRRRVSVAFS
ncbi:hypothetical protein SPAN111604_09775 [Sphingomonas antarctica]|uniref:PEPxxWA-CTERM sorting domain-containing protein n=1 Tax=Sphingomonas antarctica TaxID=2040274 RepID=UPI0039E8255D